MLIHEAAAQTGLTKKAITYYCEQGLVSPSVSENGYREFGPRDIERLIKISVLRKLGMNVSDAKSVLEDATGEALKRFSVRLELEAQSERVKREALRRLCAGAGCAEIQTSLEALENGATIAARILEAFPSYFGRFLCLHFARFLDEPVVTDVQKAAYERIIDFLDNAPVPEFSENLQACFRELTPDDDLELIGGCMAGTDALLQSPDAYLRDHRQVLERTMEYRKSDEYLRSPAFRLQSQMKALIAASGYNDVFLPAMKELSPSYAAYVRRLEAANRVFLEQYPGCALPDGQANG